MYLSFTLETENKEKGRDRETKGQKADRESYIFGVTCNKFNNKIKCMQYSHINLLDYIYKQYVFFTFL